MLSNKFEWQQDLPVEAQQKREVFARFGLAMYRAQCLERQIKLMFVSMYNQKFLQVPPTGRNPFLDEESIRKTLGQIKKELKEKASLSPTLETRLAEAVNLRNWLAHDYFRVREREMLALEGREKMISELQEKADWLQELDREFTDILKNWLCIMGISKEEIESEIENYFQEIISSNRKDV